MKITFTVRTPSGGERKVEAAIVRAFNFGYAGRSLEEVRKHVEELKELDFPAPERTPTIYPIPAEQVRAAEEVVVRGSDSYGEVEFALIQSDEGLLVTIASDHSDMVVETVSTARAKTVYPDIVSNEAWDYDDVSAHWDSLRMTCERLGDAGWEIIQDGGVDALITPVQLLEELRSRSGEENSVGTVLLSGTIAGEIRPGAAAWRNTLEDPVLGRSLVIEYAVREEPLEI